MTPSLTIWQFIAREWRKSPLTRMMITVASLGILILIPILILLASVLSTATDDGILRQGTDDAGVFHYGRVIEK